MATAALKRRDACAAKLNDSVRQLRRYLDGVNQNERVLQQKMDKVDIDREQLLASHIDYSEKGEVALTTDEMKTFIEEKIDKAVDTVDEATVKLEDLREGMRTEINTSTATAENARKLIELTSTKLESESCARLVTDIIKEINDEIETNKEAGTVDTQRVNSSLVELERTEAELNKSWNKIQCTINNDDVMTTFMTNVDTIRSEISKCRRVAGAFIIGSVKSEDTREDAQPTQSSRSSTSSKFHKLPRINPPKFTGDIRDYARFKGDFQMIVENEYDDEVYQVYVMKESCLQGESLNLVKNLQSLEEIWERLSERYGNVIDVVDSVLSDLANVVVPPRFNKHQGVINLIDTVERGVQDLTSIGKRNEIANEYTVKLIEKKLPPMIYREWVDEEDKEENKSRGDRFEVMLEFLKKERRKSEKVLQQSKEKERDSGERGGDKKDDNRRKERVNHVASGSGSKRECIVHSSASTHLTRKCKEFLKKTAEERTQLVKDLNACKLCLSVSHVGEPCPYDKTWDPCNVSGCLEMHSRLLHGAPALKNMHIHQVMTSSAQNDNRTLLLMQEILSDNGAKAFTFWDNGSAISLVSKKFARKNKLKGVKVSYDLVTVNNTVTPQHTMLYDIKIIGRNGEVNIIVAYEIEQICEETAFFETNVTEMFR